MKPKHFSKERALHLRKLLPEYVQELIPDEEKVWKKAIFENLKLSIDKNDFTATEFWFSNLEGYADSQTFSFTEDEIFELLKLLYNYCITTDNSRGLLTACSLFTYFCDKNLDVTKLTLDWKPLYEVIQNRLFSHPNIPRSSPFPIFAEQFLPFVQDCNSMFSKESTAEMLKLWRKYLNPKCPDFVAAHCCLCIFLPVHTGQHALWFEDFFSIWPMYVSMQWDYQFFSLYARLSEYEYDDIDWGPHLPFIFARISRFVHVPSGPYRLHDGIVNEYTVSKKCTDFFYEISSIDDLFPTFARLFVNLLTHKRIKDQVKKLFEELAFLLRPLHLPSYKHNSRTNSDFVDFLIDAFDSRLNNEKKFGARYLPPLTKEDCDWFVSNLLPIVVADRFLERPSIDHLKEFSEISPEIVVPALLETVQRSMKYEKLEESGLDTLTSIISVILFYHISDVRDYLSSIIEQINIVDISKTKKIFFFFIAYGQCTEIDDSYSDILLSLVQKCVKMSETIHKVDFHEIKAQMKQAISASIRNISPRLVKQLAQIVIDSKDNLHPSILKDFVVMFNHRGSSFFSKIALQDNSQSSYAMVQGLVSGVSEFVTKNYERIWELISEGIKGDNEKTRRRSIAVLRNSLVNLLSILPNTLTKSGYVSAEDVKISWHIPTDEEIKVAKIFCDRVLELMNELNQTDDIQKKILSVKIGSAAVRCLVYVVSNSNLDVIPPTNPLLNHPPVKKFYSPILKESWLSFHKFLVQFITPETNQQLLKIVLDISILLAYPREQIALFQNEIIRERQYIKNTNKVGQNRTYDTYFMHAMNLMSQRQKWINESFTEQTAEIISKVIKCSTHHDQKIRRKTEVFLTEMSVYTNNTIPYIKQIIQMIPDYINDRNGLSGILSCVSVVSPLNISYEAFPLFFDTALCICRKLPNDLPDKQPKNFRKMLIAASDMIDFYMSPFSEPFMVEKRKLFINSIVENINEATDKDQRFYLIYLSFKVSSGQVRILSHKMYEIWLNALINDEQNASELVIACLREFIEILIPRIPRRERHKYDKLTPENYDDFLFDDSSGLSRKTNKHDRLSPTREQYFDEEFLKIYFPEDYEERIKIHKILYSFFVDDISNIEKLCSLFISQQIHENESFCQTRQGLWSSLLRFFGIEYAETLLKLCIKYTTKTSLIAHHVVSGEIFASILNSMKGTKFSSIKKLLNSLLPFVSTLFNDLAFEFHKVWYVSIVSGISMRDPQRYYFLFDQLFECFPTNITQIRDVKFASLICDILLEYCWFIPSISEQIVKKVLIPLKHSNLLSYENVRESFVRAFSSVVTCYFSFDSITPDQRTVDLFNQLFESNYQNDQDSLNQDLLYITLLSTPYSIQSITVFALNQTLLHKISRFVELPMNKTIEQEKQANLALIQFIFSQWLWPCSKKPLSLENVKETLHIIIAQLTPANQPRQVQSIMLTLQEIFVISNLFFLDNEELERLLSFALTALNNPNCELQDVAGELLTFLLTSSQHLKSKIPDLLSHFREMIYGKVLSQRISGVKGILALIQSTLIFESVPDFVFDALSMLNDVSSPDLSLSQLISSAFSEFYSNAQNNMMPHVVELLSPYLNSARYCYFS